MLQAIGWTQFVAEPVAQGAHGSKGRPAVLRLRSQRGHGHQTKDPNMLKSLDFRNQTRDFLWREAVLGRLSAGVNLQQHRKRLGAFGCLLIQGFEQTKVVYRMNKMNEWHRAVDLISLQMTDQMPANRFRQGSSLPPELLGAAFAEIENS